MSETSKVPQNRGWLARTVKSRDFTRDIIVTTLGVLVALGLGAIATNIGWRLDVRNARANLADELGEAASQAQVRVITNDCVERRLDAIASILDEAERSGRLPATGNFIGARWFTWDSAVWQSVLAAGTAPHFSLSEQAGYGGAYAFISHLNAGNNEELRDWAPLYAIVGSGRRIGDEEIARLRTALMQAWQTSRLINLQSVRLLQVLKAWELPFDRTLSQDRTTVIADSRVCEPILEWSNERSGSGPWGGAVQRAIKNPITRKNR